VQQCEASRYLLLVYVIIAIRTLFANVTTPSLLSHDCHGTCILPSAHALNAIWRADCSVRMLRLTALVVLLASYAHFIARHYCAWALIIQIASVSAHVIIACAGYSQLHSPVDARAQMPGWISCVPVHECALQTINSSSSLHLARYKDHSAGLARVLAGPTEPSFPAPASYGLSMQKAKFEFSWASAVYISLPGVRPGASWAS
jgi:hypothetical protein